MFKSIRKFWDRLKNADIEIEIDFGIEEIIGGIALVIFIIWFIIT